MGNTFKARTRFLVNKGYQLHFVRLVLAQTLITSLLLIGAFCFFQQFQGEFLTRLLADQGKVQVLEHWTRSMFLKMLAVVVLAGLFHTFIAVILSHRSAGPMLRLTRYIGEISKGMELKPIAFRENDHFHDVQDAYNEMIGVLEKERQNDLRVIEQMEDGLNHLKRISKDEQVYQLADYIERLNNDLKNFKTH